MFDLFFKTGNETRLVFRIPVTSMCSLFWKSQPLMPSSTRMQSTARMMSRMAMPVGQSYAYTYCVTVLPAMLMRSDVVTSKWKGEPMRKQEERITGPLLLSFAPGRS